MIGGLLCCHSLLLYLINFISWIEDYIQPAIEQNKVEDFREKLEKTRIQLEKKARKKSNTPQTKFENHHDSDPDETETEDDSGSDNNADVKTSNASGTKIKAKAGKKKSARKAKATISKSKSKNSEADLIAAIRNKNGRGNPLASLAARYGVSDFEEDPLDDEQFAKLNSKYRK